MLGKARTGYAARLSAGVVLGLLLGFGVSAAATAGASVPTQIHAASAVPYHRDIVVMNADGAGRTNLTASRADDVNPAWSPDGTQIAFDSFSGRNQDIYLIAADGTGLRNLTKSGQVFDEAPTWSPDGTRIAFTSSGVGASSVDIFVMNPDGGNRANLTPGRPQGYGPTWSPDGRRIAFGAGNDEDFTTDIFVMNSDGSGRTRLTQNRGKGFESYVLDWSPDGARILFGRIPVGLGSPPADIWVMRADGSGKANLTRRPAMANDSWGVWSPDGTRIAFSSDRNHRPRSGRDEIYVMNADGSRKVNLTENRAFDFAPDWSPDGAKIVFSSTRGSLKNREVVVMNADGSGQTNLTRNSEEDSDPKWSPGGRRILFLSAPPQFCLVPKVIGLPLRRAYDVLSRANCSVGRVQRTASNAPRDRVLRQRPLPRTRLPYAGRVNLVVSKGPR